MHAPSIEINAHFLLRDHRHFYLQPRCTTWKLWKMSMIVPSYPPHVSMIQLSMPQIPHNWKANLNRFNFWSHQHKRAKVNFKGLSNFFAHSQRTCIISAQLSKFFDVVYVSLLRNLTQLKKLNIFFKLKELDLPWQLKAINKIKSLSDGPAAPDVNWVWEYFLLAKW